MLRTRHKSWFGVATRLTCSSRASTNRSDLEVARLHRCCGACVVPSGELDGARVRGGVALGLVGCKWIAMRPSNGRIDAHWLRPKSPDGGGSLVRSPREQAPV